MHSNDNLDLVQEHIVFQLHSLKEQVAQIAIIQRVVQHQ